MKPGGQQHRGRYEGLGLPASLYFPTVKQPSEAAIRAAQEARNQYEEERRRDPHSPLVPVRAEL